MKTKIKKILGIAGILFILIILPVIGIWSYIGTDQAQHLIQKKINQSIPGQIKWDKLKLSALSGKIEIKNTMLKGLDKEDIVLIDKIFLHVSLPELIKGNIYAKNIIIEHPQIWLKKDEKGNFNIIKAFPEPENQADEKADKKENKLNITADKVEIKNAFFEYIQINNVSDKQEKVIINNIDFTAKNTSLAELSSNLSLNINNGDIDIAGIKTGFDDFEIQADLNKITTPLSIKFNSDAANMDISGSVKQIFSKPFLDVNINLNTDLNKIRSLLNIKPELTGITKISLKIKGDLNNPELGFNLNYDGGNLAGNQVNKINLDCAMKDRLVSLKTLNADTNLGILDLYGEINLQNAFKHGFISNQKNLEAISYILSLKQTNTFLNKIPGQNENLAGIINSNLKLEGKGISTDKILLKSKLELSGKNLGFQDISIGNILLNAELENSGQVNIVKLNLENKDSVIDAKGKIKIFNQGLIINSDFPSNLNVELKNIKAENFIKKDNLTGIINANVDIKGKLINPQASVELKADNLGFEGTKIGNINADIGFSNEQISINKFIINNRNSSLNLSGTAKVLDENMKPLKNPEFNLTAKDKGIFLEDFVKGMKGKLALDARVHGSVLSPKGSISLKGTKIDLGVQKINKIKLASSLDGNQVNIDSFLITMAPGEEIVTNGWVSPLNKMYNLHMKSKGISLGNIDSLQNTKINNGKISLDLAGKGSFDNPELKGDLDINGLRINNKILDDLHLKLDVKNQLAKISGNINFDVNAQFHLQKKDFTAKLQFHKTRLAPFFKLADRNDLNGILTGIIEAKGNVNTPDNIRASADIEHLSILLDKTRLIKAEKFGLFFKNHKFSIPDIDISLLDQGYLNLKGKGEIKGPVDLELNGKIPVKVVKAFTQELQDITGSFNLAARLKGSFEKPDFQAEINLNKIGMIVPGLTQKLSSLKGKIKITPDLVSLNNIKGYLDKGEFKLSGRARMKNFKPESINASLTAHGLPIHVPDTLEVVLNTDLNIKGTLDKSSITGEVFLLEGRYYKDINLNLLAKAVEKTRPESIISEKKEQTFQNNINLDIAIKYRTPFAVDNNMVLMSLKPDLRIYGTIANPLVGGRAEAEPGGTITYQKKDFEIQKGIVDFLNPYKIEPTLDVQSQTQIRDWTIFLTVSGTPPDNLILKLTSEPHEEDGDILSLLALGRTTKELVRGEGGSSKSTTQLVADIVANTLQDNLKDSTGLDIIELKYTEAENESQSGDIQVTVGKELSRRMTVKYGMETKNGVSVQRAVTEYKFLENLLMSAFQDTQGDFGGELVFRLEFR